MISDFLVHALHVKFICYIFGIAKKILSLYEKQIIVVLCLIMFYECVNMLNVYF